MFVVVVVNTGCSALRAVGDFGVEDFLPDLAGMVIVSGFAEFSSLEDKDCMAADLG